MMKNPKTFWNWAEKNLPRNMVGTFRPALVNHPHPSISPFISRPYPHPAFFGFFDMPKKSFSNSNCSMLITAHKTAFCVMADFLRAIEASPFNGHAIL